MEPHHHVHISTGFLFVLMLALVALIVAVGFAIYLARKPKVIERVERVSQTRFIEPEADDRPYVRSVSSVGAYRAPPRQVDSTVAPPVRAYSRTAVPEPRQHYTAPYTPPYTPPVQSDRLFEGILLGELMGSSHGSTTVIESAPSYPLSSDSFSSGSDSSGFSYDSGSSSSDSGGFSCDW
ncbi:hypothetical protein C0V97_12355 [Asaia sp. W19]|uniref:hypothetical protein n=1 Tax=unclassified Asaia TaxID=2685023 RepID=UPI000F8EF05E|nr:hypothetical protein [Asaia sp. W19]RUT25368.1 hypothetical protein C0V97_12355 [Asaia sp. W19]